MNIVQNIVQNNNVRSTKFAHCLTIAHTNSVRPPPHLKPTNCFGNLAKPKLTFLQCLATSVRRANGNQM